MVQLYKTKILGIPQDSTLLFYFKNRIKWSLSISFILLLTVITFGQKSFTPTSVNDDYPDLTISDSTDLLTVPPKFDFSKFNLPTFETQTIAGIHYDTSYVAKKLRKRGQKMTVFGYYRGFMYGRNMTEAYPNLAPYEKAYGFGDGYREPTLSLNIIGRPNGRSTFATELFLLSPYLGTGPEDNVFTMNLGINFYGNFRTKNGVFGVRAGGIHWYNLSEFTIGVFQILDRFSIFDRTPWEGVNHDVKYDAYYDSGSTNAGDLRWNNQAFQGLIINGGKLPGDFNFDFFWGKTQPNAGLANGILDPFESIPPTINAGSVPTYVGFAGDARFIPNFITGGKIGKVFGKKRQVISYNLIHSQTALDSARQFILGEDDAVTFEVPNRTYQVHSLAYDLKISKIRLAGELAMGNYESPTYEKKWGEALMLRAYFPKEMTFLPIDVQLYQINKNFFNQNGAIATNSNPEILKDFGVVAGATGIGGQLALVNQLVHNRRGININTGIELGELKLNIGWGLAQEIDAESSQLTFVHRINGLALSRIYNPFPANATMPTVFGPYGRKISFFRGVTEVVQTTDLNPADAQASNRKYFNAIDLQAKYKTMIGDKPLYLFYLGSFASAKASASAIPSMSNESYLFVQYHELDAYYELFPNFLLTGYLGLEDARGGQFTEWNSDSQLPLDQLATGIGIGFDWTVSKSTGIYFRHRWMNHEDKSFALDTYKGREVTIELKTFF
jgi:hypothetical protein